jgi:putative CocE/NonD family hydrolase
MGPWTHGVLQDKAGDLTFPGAKTTPGDVHDPWKWFAATLKGETNTILEAPAVTYYVMGALGEDGAPGNEWRTADQWPPVATRPRLLRLQPDRTAVFGGNAARGTLSYTNDPANPVPAVGGYELTIPAGPKDQRSIESRDDLLVFTSEPLSEPLEVIGNAVAKLRLLCSTPDADLIVRLCDVYPDGRSFNICEGALRLRFREGLDRDVLMSPEPTEVEIKLWPTSMIFNRGHRLRVHLASSSYPALEANLQNGLAPRTGEPQAAVISIHFTGNDPHLVLPIVNQFN